MLWVALILCLVLSAYFSACEMAYSASNRVSLKAMAADGPHKKKAQCALRLLDEYDSLLTTILVGNNLVNIAASAIATILFTRMLEGSESLGATLASVVMTILILLFGEIGPKTLTKSAPESVALATGGSLRVLLIVLKPIDWLFAMWRTLLSKMIKPRKTEPPIESELITMIDEAQTEGDLDESESNLIRSAITFQDQIAADIMTPRVAITALEDTATVKEASEVFRKTWFSRIPVYHEDLDHVTGILNEKDYYQMLHDGCTDIRKVMRKPVFAPSSLQIGKLLKLFRTSKSHLIILLDEYGGTEGLVTLEDTLEELVGEIYDEHDDISEELVESADGTCLVDGAMQLDELLERYDAKNTFEADTVGGWVSEMLEKVPKVGDRFTYRGLTCEVVGMDGRRVTRVRLSGKLVPPEDDEEQG